MLGHFHLDLLRLVQLSHLVKKALVQLLGVLPAHGEAEVWLVALHDVAEGELADAEHLQVQVQDALVPTLALVVVKRPRAQDLLGQLFRLRILQTTGARTAFFPRVSTSTPLL